MAVRAGMIDTEIHSSGGNPERAQKLQGFPYGQIGNGKGAGRENGRGYLMVIIYPTPPIYLETLLMWVGKKDVYLKEKNTSYL